MIAASAHSEQTVNTAIVTRCTAEASFMSAV